MGDSDYLAPSTKAIDILDNIHELFVSFNIFLKDKFELNRYYMLSLDGGTPKRHIWPHAFFFK